MKKSTYMIIDIAILTIFSVVAEMASLLFLKNVFPDQMFTLSVVITISIITIMRWKWAGFLPAVMGGLVLCVIQGGSGMQYLVYMGGNAFVALISLWFIWLKPERIAQSLPLTLAFALSGYLVVILGRGLLSLFAGAGVAIFASFLIAELVNIVIGLFIIIIARRQKGMFESQEIYLHRLAAEKKESGSND